MDERRDETQEQFDQPQSQEPGEGGHPEEAPGGGGQDRSGGDPHSGEHGSGDKPGSSAGAAGEGTQSTGHPGNAG